MTNAVIVPVGDGRICFTSLGVTDLVVDMNGWLTPSSTSGLVSASKRLVDTRYGVGGVHRLAAGAEFELVVTANPATTAVALSVTAVDPSSAGS